MASDSKTLDSSKMANVNNVSLNDIKKYIAKYRTLPMKTKQNSVIKQDNIVKNDDNNQNNYENISNINNITNNNNNNYNEYRARVNNRQGYNIKDEEEEHMDFNDNEYSKNIITHEHARRLDRLENNLLYMNDSSKKLESLLELKQILLDTISSNLQRNNNITGTYNQESTNNVYDYIKTEMKNIFPDMSNLQVNTDAILLMKNMDTKILEMQNNIRTTAIDVENIKNSYTSLNSKFEKMETSIYNIDKSGKNVIDNQVTLLNRMNNNDYSNKLQSQLLQKFDEVLIDVRDLKQKNVITNDSIAIFQNKNSNEYNIKNEANRIYFDQIFKEIKSELSLIKPNTNQDLIVSLNERLNDIFKNVISLNNASFMKGLDVDLKKAIKDNNNNVLELATKYDGLLKKYEERSFRPIDSGENKLDYDRFLSILETVYAKNNEILQKFTKTLSGIEISAQKSLKGVEEKLAIEGKTKQLAIEYNKEGNNALMKKLSNIDEQFSTLNSSISSLNDTTKAITNSDRTGLINFQNIMTNLMNQNKNDILALTNGSDNRQQMLFLKLQELESNVLSDNKLQSIEGLKKLMIEFDSNMKHIITSSELNKKAIEEAINEYADKTHKSIEYSSEQQKRMVEALYESLNNKKNTLSIEEATKKMIEMSNENFNTVKLFFDEKAILDKQNFEVGMNDIMKQIFTKREQRQLMNDPLKIDNNTPTISSSSIPTTSNTNALTSVTSLKRRLNDVSNYANNIREYFKNELNKRLDESVDMDTSYAFDGMNEDQILKCVNSNILISGQYVNGRHNKKLIDLMNEYNNDIFEKLNSYRNDILESINNREDEDTTFKKMNNFGQYYTDVLNSADQYQIKKMYEGQEIFAKESEGLQIELLYHLNTYITNRTYNVFESNKVKRITNSVAPVLNTISETSEDGVVNSKFTPNCKNNKILKTQVNPVTQQNQIVTEELFSPAAVPQQLGNNTGERLNVSNSVLNQTFKEIVDFLDEVDKKQNEIQNSYTLPQSLKLLDDMQVTYNAYLSEKQNLDRSQISEIEWRYAVLQDLTFNTITKLEESPNVTPDVPVFDNIYGGNENDKTITLSSDEEKDDSILPELPKFNKKKFDPNETSMTNKTIIRNANNSFLNVNNDSYNIETPPPYDENNKINQNKFNNNIYGRVSTPNEQAVRSSYLQKTSKKDDDWVNNTRDESQRRRNEWEKKAVHKFLYNKSLNTKSASPVSRKKDEEQRRTPTKERMERFMRAREGLKNQYGNETNDVINDMGEGVIRRKSIKKEILKHKENVVKIKNYIKSNNDFLDEESKKRKEKIVHGNGIHHSLNFRRKLLSLIKSNHIKLKDKGKGVSKKLVCSLCDNKKNDDYYHKTKSGEILHKKCFEGKGMTKKRKLIEEDYGEDITENSHDPSLRKMYEDHDNAKQEEIIDKVKLNNVHNDHMQSVNSNLKILAERSKKGFIAFGKVDNKLFSLLCYLLGVLNNNKDNASHWDYINYQVLRSKYLDSIKANPKLIKYIDIDTSNQESIEKAIKSHPEALFDYDFE